MTQFATERALWEITGSMESLELFNSDPDTLLDRYLLSDEEKALLKQKDVKALAERGNSDMLVMLFWLATSGGFATLPEYLGRMNAPAG